METSWETALGLLIGSRPLLGWFGKETGAGALVLQPAAVSACGCHISQNILNEQCKVAQIRGPDIRPGGMVGRLTCVSGVKGSGVPPVLRLVTSWTLAFL